LFESTNVGNLSAAKISGEIFHLVNERKENTDTHDCYAVAVKMMLNIGG
jgi:hypothetical protein